jgi:hypothetical protein
MFGNMVKSATFRVIWEALNAVDYELNGVQARLDEFIAKDSDDVAIILAKQQVKLLQVWRPMIENLVNDLHQQHMEVHGTAPPSIQRSETTRGAQLSYHVR